MSEDNVLTQFKIQIEKNSWSLWFFFFALPMLFHRVWTLICTYKHIHIRIYSNIATHIRSFEMVKLRPTRDYARHLHKVGFFALLLLLFENKKISKICKHFCKCLHIFGCLCFRITIRSSRVVKFAIMNLPSSNHNSHICVCMYEIISTEYNGMHRNYFIIIWQNTQHPIW